MPSKKKIDDALAREMYSRGCLDPEIASAFGVSAGVIGRWRRKNGLKSNWLISGMNDSHREKALVLYRSGCSDYEIGRQVGALGATVKKWRDREGLAAHGARRPGLGKKVLRLLDDGLTPNEVAAKLDCQSAYVRATRARRKNPNQWRKWSRDAYQTHARLIGRV